MGEGVGGTWEDCGGRATRVFATMSSNWNFMMGLFRFVLSFFGFFLGFFLGFIRVF